MPKKPTYHRRVADIVKRLPLHRSLDESQSMLVALTPHWNSWLQSAVNNNTLPRQCAKTTFLSGWQAEQAKLIINCDNASNASLIKHQSARLLKHLNRKLSEGESVNQTPSPLITFAKVKPTKPTSVTSDSKTPKSDSVKPSTSKTSTIKKIVVRLNVMSSATSPYQDDKPSSSLFDSQVDIGKDENSPKLSANSLAALENCQNRTSSDALATALKNLTETLKNT